MGPCLAQYEAVYGPLKSYKRLLYCFFKNDILLVVTKLKVSVVFLVFAGLWYTTRDDSPDETSGPEPPPRQFFVCVFLEIRNKGFFVCV